jgi:hypothetical protein
MNETIDFKLTLVNKTNETFYFNKIIPNYHFSISKLEINPNDRIDVVISIAYDMTLQAELFLDKISIQILNFRQIYSGSSIFSIPLDDPSYKSNIIFKKRYQPQPKLLQISEVILEILNK